MRLTWGDNLRAKCDRLAVKYKIEYGIPIPPPRRFNRHRVAGFSSAVRSLKRGGCVLLPINQAAANALGSRYIGSGAFVTRTYPTGTRIWRTR